MRWTRAAALGCILVATPIAVAQETIKSSIDSFRLMIRERFREDHKFPKNQVALESFDKAMEAMASAKGDPKSLTLQDAALRNIALDFVSRKEIYARFVVDYTHTVGNPGGHILIARQATSADLKPAQGYIWQYMLLRPRSERALAHSSESILTNVILSNGPGTVPVLYEAMLCLTSSNLPAIRVYSDELNILSNMAGLLRTAEALNAMCESAAKMEAQWQSQAFRGERDIDPVSYLVALVRPSTPERAAEWQSVIEGDDGAGLSPDAKAVLNEIKARASISNAIRRITHNLSL